MARFCVNRAILHLRLLRCYMLVVVAAMMAVMFLCMMLFGVMFSHMCMAHYRVCSIRLSGAIIACVRMRAQGILRLCG